VTQEAPLLWFVFVPNEDAPHMHQSLQSASAEADVLARMHVGQTISIFQLKSVGSIKYPNTPTIFGDFKR
jgi:hypothetical protein